MKPDEKSSPRKFTANQKLLRDMCKFPPDANLQPIVNYRENMFRAIEQNPVSNKRKALSSQEHLSLKISDSASPKPFTSLRGLRWRMYLLKTLPFGLCS
ncbi:hypothetical protein RRG08_048573 [Elysia crispata]|uniref:Uncharacterized protein n=1 Tax=Elysia crispata TaxID=231223 RepID=A0AAE1B573_9GAST|nr:hypothetical protein RRG08_048573 [Elysia crispata]